VQTPRAGVVVLQLNRPERLNAINEVMLGELRQTVAALALRPKRGKRMKMPWVNLVKAARWSAISRVWPSTIGTG
jgi:hypothetical protein